MLIILLICIPIIGVSSIPFFIISVMASTQASFFFMAKVVLLILVAFVCIFPLVWGYISYYSYTFALSADELIIKKGFIIGKPSHIPFKHMTNITIVRRHIMELIGLYEVQIMLHGSEEDKPTITIAGLSVSEAQMIRNAYLESTTPKEWGREHGRIQL